MLLLVVLNAVQKALQVLEDNADYESEYMRALAFRKAICSLASAPTPIRNMSDLNKLINLGEHSKRVVQVNVVDNFTKHMLIWPMCILDNRL